MKGKTAKIISVFCAMLFITFTGGLIKVSEASPEVTIIKVAIYNVTRDDPYLEHWNESVTGRAKYALDSYGEFWSEGNKYKFQAYIVGFSDVTGSGLNDKDVFVAPGGNFYWYDQWINFLQASTFRTKIKDFVDDGGGYVGTCGGASIATKGKSEPSGGGGTTDPYDGAPVWLKSTYFFNMVNVWSNNAWKEEQQYDRDPYNTWRGGIPLNSEIKNNNDALTILGVKDVTRNIRYWGGPAFFGDESHFTPLAEYDQEPESKYPIHWFGGSVVDTDLKVDDGYSIINSTYGDGRLVLFGPHPELRSFYHGTANDIVENFLKTKYRFDKSLDDDTDDNLDLLCRAVRWTCHKEAS